MTLEWDGTEWAARTPATSPPTRQGRGMVYDEARREVVVFGRSSQNDTWVWNGFDWTQRVTATTPAGRSECGMVAVLDAAGVALGTIALTNGLQLTFGD